MAKRLLLIAFIFVALTGTAQASLQLARGSNSAAQILERVISYAWKISEFVVTAGFSYTFSTDDYGTVSEGIAMTGIHFSSSGSELIAMENHSNIIHTHDLGTAWKPAGMVEDTGKRFDLDTIISLPEPSDITCNPAITKCFVADWDDAVIRTLEMSTALDPSTITYSSANDFDVSAYQSSIRDVEFVLNGSRFCWTGTGSAEVDCADTSTAYEVAGATYSASYNWDYSSAIASGSRSMVFANNDTQLCIGDDNNDRISCWLLSEAGNPSTAAGAPTYVYDHSAFTTPSIGDLFFKPDGESLFIDSLDDTIYVVGVPVEVETITTDNLTIDIPDATSWVGVYEVRVVDDTSTEQFASLTNVAGNPSNTLATISAGEFTTNSDYNSNQYLNDNAPNINVSSSPVGTVHWADQGNDPNGNLTVFAKWASSFNLCNVYIVMGINNNPENATFVANGETLTPTLIPINSGDVFETTGSGTNKWYRYGFC